MLFLSKLLKAKKMHSSTPLISNNDAYFKVLAETTESLVFIHDDEKFLYVNPSFIKTTGYSKEELLSMNFFNLLHPDFFHFVYDYNLINKNSNIDSERYEVKIISKSGKFKWLDIIVGVTYIHNKIQIIGNAMNITRRKRQESALKENEERYRKLFELYPDAVYLMENSRILFTNNAGAKILGAEFPSEVNHKNIDSFIKFSDEKKLEIKEALRTIEKFGVWSNIHEQFVRACDNEILNVETVASSLTFLNKDLIFIVIRDISYRLKIEKLEKDAVENNKLVDKAKQYEIIRNEFFANISHELRTPLNLILSTLQVMEIENSSFVSFKNSKYINIMKRNSNRILKLVNNLIDITKIDGGYLKPTYSLCNIVSLVEDTTMSTLKYIKKKNIDLIFDTDIEEKNLYCDVNKIKRVILNLLSNSAKFTNSQGFISVSVRNKNSFIEISVKDTGIGIQRDKQKIIFEKFAQVDKSLSRISEGTGMGLSIVKSFIELHKGSVKLVSSYGKGSEFIISIPTDLKPDFTDECACTNLNYSIDSNLIDVEFSDVYV